MEGEGEGDDISELNGGGNTNASGERMGDGVSLPSTAVKRAGGSGPFWQRNNLSGSDLSKTEEVRLLAELRKWQLRHDRVRSQTAKRVQDVADAKTSAARAVAAEKVRAAAAEAAAIEHDRKQQRKAAAYEVRIDRVEQHTTARRVTGGGGAISGSGSASGRISGNSSSRSNSSLDSTTYASAGNKPSDENTPPASAPAPAVAKKTAAAIVNRGRTSTDPNASSSRRALWGKLQKMKGGGAVSESTSNAGASVNATALPALCACPHDGNMKRHALPYVLPLCSATDCDPRVFVCSEYVVHYPSQ